MTGSLDQRLLIAHAEIFLPRGISWREFNKSLSKSIKGDNSNLNDCVSELKGDS